MNAFTKYANEAHAAGNHALVRRLAAEGQIARALVKAGLARGLLVSVNDGEGWVVLQSVKLTEIMNALASTDEDYVRFTSYPAGQGATFVMVYGNDGYDVINDHTDNDLGNLLIADIQPTIDRLERALAI